MKNKIIIVGALASILVAGFFFARHQYQDQKSQNLSFLAQENAKLFVPDYAPIMGVESAQVYIVEFLDPECESCRSFYPVVKKVMKEYEKDLKLVVRYAPFHKNSKNAVQILEATRLQGKYWETLEIMFATQPQWADHHNPQPELIWDIIPAVGVDVDRAKADMMNPEIMARIQQDIEDGKTLGVRRTPSFFVNGTPLLEFGYEPFVELVEREIKKVNDAL